MDINQSCTPWFFPSEEDKITICDPWQSIDFMKYFNSVPENLCTYCLPGNAILL